MTSSSFYDSANYPFVSELQNRCQDIYSEFLSVQDSLIDYVEPDLYDQGWRVFGLWNLPHREPIIEGRLRCPRTSSLIESLVPSHGAVAFSVLMPGTHIRAHLGRPGPYLRCHLALEVPEGDCRIRVVDDVRFWEAGRGIVFDDRLEHEAWNRTKERRVVLLFDFIPEGQ